MKKRNWILSVLMTVVLVANVAVCFGNGPVDFVKDDGGWKGKTVSNMYLNLKICRPSGALAKVCEEGGGGCSVDAQHDCE